MSRVQDEFSWVIAEISTTQRNEYIENLLLSLEDMDVKVDSLTHTVFHNSYIRINLQTSMPDDEETAKNYKDYKQNIMDNSYQPLELKFLLPIDDETLLDSKIDALKELCSRLIIDDLGFKLDDSSDIEEKRDVEGSFKLALDLIFENVYVLENQKRDLQSKIDIDELYGYRLVKEIATGDRLIYYLLVKIEEEDEYFFYSDLYKVWNGNYIFAKIENETSPNLIKSENFEDRYQQILFMYSGLVSDGYQAIELEKSYDKFLITEICLRWDYQLIYEFKDVPILIIKSLNSDAENWMSESVRRIKMNKLPLKQYNNIFSLSVAWQQQAKMKETITKFVKYAYMTSGFYITEDETNEIQVNVAHLNQRTIRIDATLPFFSKKEYDIFVSKIMEYMTDDTYLKNIEEFEEISNKNEVIDITEDNISLYNIKSIDRSFFNVAITYELKEQPDLYIQAEEEKEAKEEKEETEEEEKEEEEEAEEEEEIKEKIEEEESEEEEAEEMEEKEGGKREMEEEKEGREDEDKVENVVILASLKDDGQSKMEKERIRKRIQTLWREGWFLNIWSKNLWIKEKILSSYFWDSKMAEFRDGRLSRNETLKILEELSLGSKPEI